MRVSDRRPPCRHAASPRTRLTPCPTRLRQGQRACCACPAGLFPGCGEAAPRLAIASHHGSDSQHPGDRAVTRAHYGCAPAAQNLITTGKQSQGALSTIKSALPVNIPMCCRHARTLLSCPQACRWPRGFGSCGGSLCRSDTKRVGAMQRTCQLHHKAAARHTLA
jgi:hypothetical protein